MVLNQFTRLFIPIHTKSNQNLVNVEFWNEFVYTTDKLSKQMYNLLSKKSIYQSYILKHEMRSSLNLPKDHRTKIILKLSNHKSTTTLHLKDIYLHVLLNRTILIDFELSFDAKDLSELIDGQYFLTEMYQISGKMTFEFKKGKDSVETYDFNFSDIIKNLLGSKDEYQISLNDEHLLSYTLIDQSYDQIDYDFELLKHYFKSSYKINRNQNKSNFRPFDNSWWGFTDYSASNLSYLVGDEYTDQFFSNQFDHQLRQHYVFLYIISVLEKFDYIKIIEMVNNQIIKEPRSIEECKNELKQIDEIEKDWLNLDTHTTNSIVSIEQHIQDYYQYIRISNHIETLRDELIEKVKNIRKLANMYHDTIMRFDTEQQMKIERINLLQHTRFDLIVFIVTQIVGSFAVLKTSWEITEMIYAKQVTIRSDEFLVPLGITIIFFLFLMWVVMVKIKEYSLLVKNE